LHKGVYRLGVEQVKAIVAEIDNKHMIVITEKGDFIKVKRNISAGIGDEIELKPHNTTLLYRRLAAMAACLLMVVFMTTGVYAYYTPYSYVSVDINPSIALTLNRFDRVISVDMLTEDGTDIIENTSKLKNKGINTAMAEIIRSASEKGYITPESENQVMVVVSAKNSLEEDILVEEVSAAAHGELVKASKNYEVMVEKTSVSDYKAAVAKNVSPGREILKSKVKEVAPELADEEIRNMTVKEAAALIKEGRKAIKEENKNKDKEKTAVTKEKPDKANIGEEPGKGKKPDTKGEKDNKAAATNKKHDDNDDKGNSKDKAIKNNKDNNKDKVKSPGFNSNLKNKDKDGNINKSNKDDKDKKDDKDGKIDKKKKENDREDIKKAGDKKDKSAVKDNSEKDKSKGPKDNDVKRPTDPKDKNQKDEGPKGKDINDRKGS
jgi:hypothetical protein